MRSKELILYLTGIHCKASDCTDIVPSTCSVYTLESYSKYSLQTILTNPHSFVQFSSNCYNQYFITDRLQPNLIQPSEKEEEVIKKTVILIAIVSAQTANLRTSQRTVSINQPKIHLNKIMN